MAAESLRQELREDATYLPAYIVVAEGVYRGLIDPEHVIEALRQATSGKAKNRGAVFNTALTRETGVKGSDLPAFVAGKELARGHP